MTKTSAFLLLFLGSIVIIAVGVRALTGSRRAEERKLSTLQARERLWMDSRQEWDKQQHKTQFRNTRVSVAGTVATLLGLLMALIGAVELTQGPEDKDDRDGGQTALVLPDKSAAARLSSETGIAASESENARQDGSPTTALMDAGDDSTFGLSPSAPTVPSRIEEAEAEQLLLTYFRTAGRRAYSEAWSMLSARYQNKYGSFSNFSNFWDKVHTVGPSDLIPTHVERTETSIQFVAEVYFELRDGSRTEETVSVRVQRDLYGSLLIDDYESLG